MDFVDAMWCDVVQSSVVSTPALVDIIFHQLRGANLRTQIDPADLAGKPTCTNCHARADHASGFKLTPVSDRYADTDAMRANAAAATAFVNRDDLGASPLLMKAITAHGGQREPGIRGREHPAYRNLEQWVLVSAPPAKPQAAQRADPFDPTEFNRAAHPGR